MSEMFFELVSRARSFKIGWWPYTDMQQFSPYVLASQGYTVTKPYCLQCCVCHHAVKIPFQLEQKAPQILQSLRNHNKNCIFHPQVTLPPSNPTPKETLYLLMDQIISQFKPSYQLLKQTNQFPLINKQKINHYIDKESYTMKFVNEAYKLNLEKELNIAFFLQFFCWKLKRYEEDLTAQCLMCGREVNLRKFGQRQMTNQPINMQIDESQAFDLAEQHRYFCLWMNKKCSGYAGWQIFLQHTYDKIIQSKSLFSKRAPEETKKIRVQLDRYLQTFSHKTSQQFQKIRDIFSECELMKRQIEKEIENQQQKPSDLVVGAENRMNQFLENIEKDFKDKLKKIKLD